MCENCNGEPRELSEEERGAMRAEATAAAMQTIHCFRHRWLNACDGLVQDQSQNHGFEAVMRMCWVYGKALVHLPLPQDAPSVWASADTVAKKVKEHGMVADDAMMTGFLRTNDQVQAAYNEIVALAATGTEEAFCERLDEVTDQAGIVKPLVMSLMAHAAMAVACATDAGNTAGLDQFKGAIAEGFVIEGDEVDDLQAMFSMPDADRT